LSAGVLGQVVVGADLLADHLGGAGVVAGEHQHPLDAMSAQRGDGVGDAVADRAGHPQHPQHPRGGPAALGLGRRWGLGEDDRGGGLVLQPRDHLGQPAAPAEPVTSTPREAISAGEPSSSRSPTRAVAPAPGRLANASTADAAAARSTS
jgi:hypothetical protein